MDEPESSKSKKGEHEENRKKVCCCCGNKTKMDRNKLVTVNANQVLLI